MSFLPPIKNHNTEQAPLTWRTICSCIALTTMICLLVASSILSLTHLRLFSGGKKKAIIALSVLSLTSSLIFIPRLLGLAKRADTGGLKVSKSNALNAIFVVCIPFFCLSLALLNVFSFQKLLCPRYFSIASKINAAISTLSFFILFVLIPKLFSEGEKQYSYYVEDSPK